METHVEGKYASVYQGATPEVYDAWAQDGYEEDVGRGSRGADSVARVLVEQLGAEGAGAVLDAGCGTGGVVDALKRLEYRGYDSAGVATLESDQLDRRRAEGKLVNLEQRLGQEPLSGTTGIGHTRWATHGVPNEVNAHPHFSENVALVHNGIIENFRDLKDELEADGYRFASETDTEVVAHLIARNLKTGLEPRKAAQEAIKRLEGAFALAIMFRDEPDLIVGARNGPPLNCARAFWTN